jgi:hypothetical protein
VSWSVTHVMHWLRWAVNTFKSASIDFKDWDLINGKRLCELNHDEFKVNVQGTVKSPNFDTIFA